MLNSDFIILYLPYAYKIELIILLGYTCLAILLPFKLELEGAGAEVVEEATGEGPPSQLRLL